MEAPTKRTVRELREREGPRPGDREREVQCAPSFVFVEEEKGNPTRTCTWCLLSSCSVGQTLPPQIQTAHSAQEGIFLDLCLPKSYPFFLCVGGTSIHPP